MEIRLGPGQVGNGGSHAPVEGSGAHRLIDNVETEAGQVKNAGFVSGIGTGKCLQAPHPHGRDVAAAVLAEEHFALHFGTDRLPVVVIEHQAVHVIGEVLNVAGDARVGREIFPAEGQYVHTALVDMLSLSSLRPLGYFRVVTAVEQCVPARSQVVQSRTFVSEISIGRPPALAVVLGSEHHVHAAVDYDIRLFAERESADGGAVADDRNHQSAFAPSFVNRMAEIGKIEDRHAEQFEYGVGAGCVSVGNIDVLGQ